MLTLQMSDHQALAYVHYPVKQPRAVVQLVHGSCEHIGRYQELATYLTQQGFAVYGSDHRGHGQTATVSDYGYFDWERIVTDLKELNDEIKTTYPNVPIIMIGHSMGSFLARHYALCYGKTLSGLVLSGSAHQSKRLLQVGCLAAKTFNVLKGERYISNTLNDLSYGQFNAAFKPARTTHDWLTRDETIVDLFLQDEQCGFVLTSKGFLELFKGLRVITDAKQFSQTPKDLPIYFISGELDPVGGNGKMIKRAVKCYQEVGLNVEMKLYKDARHEIFNELNRTDVYEDVLRFIEKKCL